MAKYTAKKRGGEKHERQRHALADLSPGLTSATVARTSTVWPAATVNSATFMRKRFRGRDGEKISVLPSGPVLEAASEGVINQSCSRPRRSSRGPLQNEAVTDRKRLQLLRCWRKVMEPGSWRIRGGLGQQPAEKVLKRTGSQG